MLQRALFIAAWTVLQISTAFAGVSNLAPALDSGKLEAGRQAVLNAPLLFTKNAGQWNSRVAFGAKTRQGDLYFLENSIVLALPEAGARPLQVRLEPLGMQSTARPVPGSPVNAVTNYFIGNNPANWRLGVTSYNEVRYRDVYPGIELRFHGDNNTVEYDFLVAPGADPSRIRVRIDGAQALRLANDGSLIAELPGGRELRQGLPAIYQDIDGRRSPVTGRFTIEPAKDGAQVFGFEVAAYDRNSPLVIDPTITDSFYIGGAFNDFGNTMAFDATGDYVYVAGTTLSSIFPGDGSAGQARSQTDVFVARYVTDGSAALTQAILVGSAADTCTALAVGTTGVYLTGSTLSSDFPVTLPLFASLAGTKADAYITKLSLSLGTKLFSTFYGGTGTESGNAIAVMQDSGVDAALYVAGTTDSTDLPTRNALYSQNSGGTDGFLLKMRPDGGLIHYATYFGGTKADNITALAVSNEGDAYIAGDTLSTDLPVNHPLQSTFGGGKDAFVARLSPTGSELVFSSWLGGSGTDYATALILDQSANMYLAGSTNSTNFPVVNALYPTKSGGYDAFVTKVDTSGRYLAFSTLFGGLGDDICKTLALDQTADGGLHYLYLGGQTASANFPVDNPWTISNGAYQQNGNGFRGVIDGFVAKIDPNGRRVVHASYLGGVGSDTVNAMATPPATKNANRTLYLTGATSSPSTPSSSGFPVVVGATASPSRALLGGGKTVGTPPLTTVTDVTGQSDPFVTTITDTSYAADLPVLALGIASAAPQTGANVTLNLALTDSAAPSLINAISTIISYDSASLEPLSVTTSLGAQYQLDWQDNNAGTLRLSIIQITGAAAALPAGNLAALTFRVKYAGMSTATMVSNASTATNTNARDVMVKSVPGLVTISQHCSVIGDCDCSGAVKIWEVQSAAQKLLNPLIADMCVKSNYTIMTAADMQLIINYHLFPSSVPDTTTVEADKLQSGNAAVTLERPAVTEHAVSTGLSLRSGGESLSIIMADVDFDPTLFSDVQVTAGPQALAASKDVTANVYQPGKLRLVVLGLGNRQTMADGRIANLVFTRQTASTPLRGRLNLAASAATPDATPVALTASPLTFTGMPGPLPALNVLLNQ